MARLLVNDYAGHPFQVQLSRALAARGHDVLHTYCSSVQTPRGNLRRATSDPDCFEIRAIDLGRAFEKYGLVSRWRQEKQLGTRLAEVSKAFGPDVVVSANTPLRAQAALIDAAKDARFVFWVQDVLGVGISRALERQLPVVGGLAGRFFRHYERTLWRKSDRIVAITDDFLPALPSQHVAEGRAIVVENWAPIDEIPLLPKVNPWSVRHGLSDKRCLLYSGTLGMKHNPDLLLRLALGFRDREDVAVVVLSEGPGADYLEQKKAEHGLGNLHLMGFQPFASLPSALATADVLLAVLEPGASVFAVPSKVLTYLCAGRPLLLAVPAENLAARIVSTSGTGLVVPPGDAVGFLASAAHLVDDEGVRRRCGSNARAYAEKTFDIEGITTTFERILLS